MKRKRFTEEQIIRIVKKAQAIGNIRGLCLKHNISEQTFYRWHNKYGGMDISEARRIKELEGKNTELKKLVGDLSLANRMLKDVLGKIARLAAKRHAAEHLEKTHRVSERRACELLSLHRSTKRRQSGGHEQVALVARTHALSPKYPRMGYRKI